MSAAFAAAIVAVSGAGCSASDAMPVDQFFKRAQGVACERLVECFMVPDAATCHARGLGKLSLGSWSTPQWVEDDVHSGRVSYHPEEAEACLDAIRAGPCAPNVPDPGEACSRVLTGTVPLGGGCFGNRGECADEGRCVTMGTEGCPPATCVPRLPRLSESCAEYPFTCDHTSLCIKGKCVAKFPVGSPCPHGYECVDSAYCDKSFTCAVPTKLGDACDAFDAFTSCAGGYCNEGTGKCEPIPVPGPGQACPANVFCHGDLRCADGVCVWMPAEDEACLQGDGPVCALGLVCDDGVCVRKEPPPLPPATCP